MIVSHDLTILAMIVNASIVVKAVMAVLVLASLFSWTYIFMKVFALRRARERAPGEPRHRELVLISDHRRLVISSLPLGEAKFDELVALVGSLVLWVEEARKWVVRSRRA